jgi:hypothetical protein
MSKKRFCLKKNVTGIKKPETTTVISGFFNKGYKPLISKIQGIRSTILL